MTRATMMLALLVAACSFPAEGTGIADASSSSSDDASHESQSSTTIHGTTSPATSSSSAGEGSGSAGATTNEGSETTSEGTSESDSGDPSSSSSGDASSSSGGELEPYGPCGDDCDAAGMLCLWVSGPGCSSRWCGVCSPACSGDLECGAGECETQCVLPCDGGCPDGMDCVTAGAPFGVSCMWPEAA